jgi:hypothetical protein
MPQLAIRCHPCAPLAAEELDRWLQEEVERLRVSAPHAVLRLVRLIQPAPTGDFGIGWMLEVDAANADTPLDEDRLAAVLRDLRLLGLQPTVLRARESGGGSVAYGERPANGGG